MARERRLQCELREVQQGNFRFIQDIKADEGNFSKWYGLLVPDCPPYNKGAFKIVIVFPDEYPFEPPTIQFLTEIYHINVDKDGYAYLEITSQKWWKPSIKVIQILEILTIVLQEPSIWHPVRNDLAKDYFKDKKQFFTKAEEFTKQFSERRPTDSVLSGTRNEGEIQMRIQAELQDIQNANMKCLLDIQVDTPTIRKWRGLLVPDVAPYKNGAFKIEIVFPTMYPYVPPEIYFRTPICHPDVDERGLLHSNSFYVSCETTMIEVIQALLRILSLNDSRSDSRFIDQRHFRKNVNENLQQFLKTAEEFTKLFSEKVQYDPNTGLPNPREVIENRLYKEFHDIKNANMKCFQDIQLEFKHIWIWQGLIVPDCYPYNKGAFRVRITFPELYPFEPPRIQFFTYIHHPNISASGLVDMEIFCSKWYFEITMIQVINSLLALLSEPEPNHFIRKDILDVYVKNREKFNKTAEEYATQVSELRPYANKETCSFKNTIIQAIQYLIPSWFLSNSSAVEQNVIERNAIDDPEDKY